MRSWNLRILGRKKKIIIVVVSVHKSNEKNEDWKRISIIWMKRFFSLFFFGSFELERQAHMLSCMITREIGKLDGFFFYMLMQIEWNYIQQIHTCKITHCLWSNKSNCIESLPQINQPKWSINEPENIQSNLKQSPSKYGRNEFKKKKKHVNGDRRNVMGQSN